jgi:hypothetical protein
MPPDPSLSLIFVVLVVGTGAGLITTDATGENHPAPPPKVAAKPPPVPRWSPLRPAIRCVDATCGSPSVPILNGVRRRGLVGDERRFMRIRPADSRAAWARTTSAAVGAMYTVQAWVNNDAAAAAAHGVRFRFSLMPLDDRHVAITGIASSTNSDPLAVTDSVVLTTDGASRAYFVAGSATVTTNVLHDAPLPDAIIGRGVALGSNALDGDLEPCPVPQNGCRGAWVRFAVGVAAQPKTEPPVGSALTRKPYSPYPSTRPLACVSAADGGTLCPESRVAELNALGNSPAYGGRSTWVGDERAFLDADNTSDTSQGFAPWSRAVDVLPGDIVNARMLVHNDGLAKDIPARGVKAALATGVRLRLLVPNGAAQSHNLVAFLTDGYGRTLNAPMILRSTEPFRTQFVPGSADLVSAAQPHGIRLPDGLVKDGGTPIDWFGLDGLPGGPGTEIYVYAQLKITDG